MRVGRSERRDRGAARRDGEPVAAAIRADGGEAVCVVTDVTSRDAMTACVDETVTRYGGLEVMVHNAYRGASPHRLEDVDVELWDRNSRTAVWGSYSAPCLRTRTSPPRVIVVG